MSERTRGVFAPEYLLTTVGACALMLLAAFESMAVTTIMPLVAKDLNGESLYSLAFAGSLASGVIGMVAAGAWADRRGPMAPLFVFTAMFAAGLLIAGSAQTMPLFLVGRLVQGFGGGAISVALYVLVARVYPANLHPKIFAVIAAAWVLPSMIGPLAAGIVAELWSWHWVFLGVAVIVVPALFMMLPARRALKSGQAQSQNGDRELGELRDQVPAQVPAQVPVRDPADSANALSPAPMSTWKQLLLATLVAAAVLGLNLSGEFGRFALIAAIGCAAVALVLLAVLLPKGVLRAKRGLPTVVLMKLLAAASFFGAEAYVPYVLMSGYGFNASTAGLALAVSGVTWFLGSAMQGSLGERFSNAAFVRAGAVLVMVSLALFFVSVLSRAHFALLIAAWAIGGVGMGVMYPRLSVMVIDYSTPTTQGANSAAANIADSFGAALSLAATGLVFNAFAMGEGFAPVFALTAAIAVLGAVAAPRVRRVKA